MKISSREQPWDLKELEDLVQERLIGMSELNDKLDVARNVIEVLMEENTKFRETIDCMTVAGGELVMELREVQAERDLFAAEAEKLTNILERCVQAMEDEV